MAADARNAGGRLAIVADDLTGAADAAAPFAAAGIPAAVALRPGHDPGTAVVAVTTESRDLPEDEAAAAVRAAVAWLAADVDPGWWYKKVDSMLRGHPVAESLALAKGVGHPRVLLAPALPARDRAVRGGVAYVCGDAVARPAAPAGGGSAGGDAERQRRTAYIALATVRSGPALRAAVRALPPGVAIADGETDDDLRAVADAVLAAGDVLPGGSAGLAMRLARLLPLRGADRVAPPAVGPVLAVVASRHGAAAAQVAAVATAGEAIVVRAPTDGSLADAGTGRRLADEVAAALDSGRAVVLTTVDGGPSPLPGRVVARGLAAVASDPRVVALAGALYLSGGDAAAACLAALGADALRLGGEVEPGIPWGVAEGGSAAGRPLVTKAGSFGDEGALGRCVAFLAGGLPGDRD